MGLAASGRDSFPAPELVELKLGEVVHEAGDSMRHVYFPIDAIIWLLYVMESGVSAEIPVVGNEGLRLKDKFNKHGQLLHLVLRYTQALITQMAQPAVCSGRASSSTPAGRSPSPTGPAWNA